MQPNLKFTIAIALTCEIGLFNGCAAMRPNASASPEYRSAKDAIESYEDDEGNYVRPEGLKAKKKKDSILGQNLIPGFGSKPTDQKKAREEYAKGDQLFLKASDATGKERSDLFKQAAKQYKQSAKYWTSSTLEQDAWLMAGESFFFAEEYPEAEEMYVRLFRDYPRNRYEDLINKRRMELGLYWVRYDRADHKPFYVLNMFDQKRPWNDTGNNGKRVLEKMRIDSPTNRLADDATMELANNAFAKGDYEGAASLYGDLRTTYPDSNHQFDAHFLGLKSELQTYVSYEYDGQALDRAEKLLKQIHRQFPNESREHEEYLKRVYAEIQFRRAERLVAKARYRINRGENQAAVVFLRQVVKDYPDTPFAEEAQTQLAAVGDLPAQPERHFQWLADMVPHNDPVSKIRREVDQGSPSPTLPDGIKPMNENSMIANVVDGMTTPDGPTQARVAGNNDNSPRY